MERFDESEALLAEAHERFPSDRRVLFDSADLATQRKKWVLALARWQEAQRRFPDDPRIESRIYVVQMRMVEAEPNTAATLPPDVASASAGQNADDLAPQPLEPEPPPASASQDAEEAPLLLHETEEPTAGAAYDAEDAAPLPHTTEPPTPAKPELVATRQDRPPQAKPGRLSRVFRTLSTRMRGTDSDASLR